MTLIPEDGKGAEKEDSWPFECPATGMELRRIFGVIGWITRPSDSFNRRQPMGLRNSGRLDVAQSQTITVVWDGSVKLVDGSDDSPVSETVRSHFGSGIVTWTLPYLFVTPPGFSILLIRGRRNLPIDGASALEGLIEADWAPVTATMNWQLSAEQLGRNIQRWSANCDARPGRTWVAREPQSSVAQLTDNEPLMSAYTTWRDGRDKFLRNLAEPTAIPSSLMPARRLLSRRSRQGSNPWAYGEPQEDRLLTLAKSPEGEGEVGSDRFAGPRKSHHERSD